MGAKQKGREKKGVFKNNNTQRQNSAAALPRCEWNKQLSRPPTLMISQANCLLCGSSGGNNFLSHIFENICRQLPSLLLEFDSFNFRDHMAGC